jgi:aromatic-L-amino-acid decarboxylase
MLEPTLSICCFRYRTPDGDGLDELNQQLLRRLLHETDLVLSATVVRGSFVLRPCFINPRTKWEDVEALVDAVIAIGDDLARGGTGAARPSA